MGLVKEESAVVATTSSGSPATGINAQITTSGTLYTVPAGRYFEGTIMIHQPNNYYWKMNDMTVYLATYYYAQLGTFILGAGTVISHTNSGITMVISGIERDLA